LVADEIVGPNGAAEVGPTMLPPIVDETELPHESLEPLRAALLTILRVPEDLEHGSLRHLASV
jgi:hypothetical protein